jgi:arginine deiminase
MCSGSNWRKRIKRFRDHNAQRGYEVLDVNILLAEVLDIPKARKWVLDHRITANDVGTGMLDELLGWMNERPAAKLAEYLIGRLEVGDLPFKPEGLFGSYLGLYRFILPPCPTSFSPATIVHGCMAALR